MMELLFKTLRSQKRSTAENGFTLIELLIVVLIAGGIISGLMFMVVELLTADQREASRNQTQQEMQMSVDYISAELREAVYVYDEACLSSTANGSADDPDYCPGLLNHLPAALSTGGSTPVLAFWKQEPLQEEIREACGKGDDIADTPCIAGHAYALVVYSTDTGGSDIWEGKSRITRYELNKYVVAADDSYSATEGYVDPSAYGNEFRSWPFYQGSGDATRINKQSGTLPTGKSDVLVDFVDDVALKDRLDENAQCPNGYSFSAPLDQLAGFYACVSNETGLARNRDVILSLRGNAYGRPAIGGENAFLPMIETNVLNRPVLNASPSDG